MRSHHRVQADSSIKPETTNHEGATVDRHVDHKGPHPGALAG